MCERSHVAFHRKVEFCAEWIDEKNNIKEYSVGAYNQKRKQQHCRRKFDNYKDAKKLFDRAVRILIESRPVNYEIDKLSHGK